MKSKDGKAEFDSQNVNSHKKQDERDLVEHFLEDGKNSVIFPGKKYVVKQSMKP